MPEAQSVRPRQFVTFQLHGELFGFDIRLVKEITPAVHITPVPLHVGDVSGVVNIRGQVVVVLDIGVTLGSAAQVLSDESQIIILKTSMEAESVVDLQTNFDASILGDVPVGFLVDSVGDIVSASAEAIEAAPSHLQVANRHFVEGVVHHDSAPLVILNPGALLGEAS